MNLHSYLIRPNSQTQMSVTINDTTYTATLTVPSTLIESYADFEITVENNQTVGFSVTENDFPSNVFIDTIGPTIELEGDTPYIVYVGDDNYTIPGAIASDGSPGYSASNYDLLINHLTFNISIVGTYAQYVYTSHPDAAGNLGTVITRSVAVQDYTPFDISALTVRSDNSLDSYAKVGDEIRLGITTDDTIETVTGTILG